MKFWDGVSTSNILRVHTGYQFCSLKPVKRCEPFTTFANGNKSEVPGLQGCRLQRFVSVVQMTSSLTFFSNDRNCVPSPHVTLQILQSF